MRRATGLLLGLGLSLAAGAAVACPEPRACDPSPAYKGQGDDYNLDNPYTEDRYGRGYGQFDDDGFGASPWYRDGRRRGPAPGPSCACEALRLPSSLFYDAGGVGPIPLGGYAGGGVYVLSGASGFGAASAQAFASASASVRVNVGVRGGFHGGHGRRR